MCDVTEIPRLFRLHACHLHRYRPSERNSHGVAAAAVLLVLLGALVACGYGSERPRHDGDTRAAGLAADGKKLSADTVKIGYLPSLTHAPVLVGIQKGMFQKELGGTKVRVSTFNAGPSEIEALNAGSIDIGWIGPSPAINGYTKSKGQNLRIVGGCASGGVKLVVNNKIKTLDDIKGRKIATPELGNTQDVAFLNWVSEKGWKVDAASGKGDVSLVRTDNTVTPNAFRQGSIDGAWVPEPTASRLVADGGKVLLDEADLWPGGQFVVTNIIASQKFLKEHPDVVEAVLRGSVRINEWIHANQGEAKAAANAALESQGGKVLPADVLDPAWQSIEAMDDPLAATLTVEADHAVKAGLLQRPDLNGIYDLGPLNKVLNSLGKPAVSDAGLGVE